MKSVISAKIVKDILLKIKDALFGAVAGSAKKAVEAELKKIKAAVIAILLCTVGLLFFGVAAVFAIMHRNAIAAVVKKEELPAAPYWHFWCKKTKDMPEKKK
ncbi:MAG: hypothetical protein J5879_06025 [Clostridia bacterium]|nr:hypothetical protein [Clostridia bacterium]